MSDSTSSASRRAVLAAGTTSIAALAGCSRLGAGATSAPELDRIVLRADTGQVERLFLTLVYAPRDGSTERPVWGVHEAPASGEPVAINDFEGTPGFYSLTAVAEHHDTTGVVSFNSHGNAVGDGALQFEVVVKESGSVWTNLNHAGEAISIPG